MKTRIPTLLLAGATALSLAACGSAGTPAAAPQDGKLTVVASTDVYGSIVSAVGGDLVQVTSIIDRPDADPHEYESTPADALAVAKAALVVKNGGGYDDFADKLVAAAGTNPTVIDAVELSGLEPAEPAGQPTAAADGHDHAGFNEHVWYDVGAVRTVANAIASELGTKDPAHAATFTANAQRFGTELDGLQQKIDAIKARHSGQPVAVTEPVPLYVIEAAGLENVTPEEFSEAVEEGTDPPAAVLAETLQVVAGVKVLIANSQTEGPTTQRVEAAARAAGVPVVGVSETLPEGVDSYVAWQSAQLDALAGALDNRA